MQPIPRSRYVIFFTIATVGCAVDLWTKSWAFDRLGFPGPENHEMIRVLDDIFTLEAHLNEGALFGVGQGRASLFAALSIGAAIGVVIWLFAAGAARDLLLTVALGCVVGGIFGNLYDRLGWHQLTWMNDGRRGHAIGDPVYAVRDFLHFKLPAIGFDWPVFNIADALLVCGAGLLVLHAFRQPKDGAGEPKESASARG